METFPVNSGRVQSNTKKERKISLQSSKCMLNKLYHKRNRFVPTQEIKIPMSNQIKVHIKYRLFWWVYKHTALIETCLTYRTLRNKVTKRLRFVFCEADY